MTNPLHESQYMTNSSKLNDVVGGKVLYFINNEDQEALGYKTLWHTNVVASHRENKFLGLCICVLTTFKICLIYVLGCEKRNPKQIQKPGPKFRSGKLKIVVLDRLSCCRAIY